MFDPPFNHVSNDYCIVTYGLRCIDHKLLWMMWDWVNNNNGELTLSDVYIPNTQ